LPAGQLRRRAVRERRKPHEFQHFERQALALRLGYAAHLGAVSHVLCHAHVRKQRVILKNRIDAAIEGRDVGDILAVKHHIPMCRAIEARDQAQAGGLSGSGGAEQREEFTRRNG